MEEEDIEEDIDEEEEEYDSKMERITTVLAVIAALLIGCIVLFLVGKTLGILPFGGETGEEETTEEDSGQVEMPKVVGRQLEEVKTELMGLGLMPEITYKETDEYEAGLILECNIGIGQMVDSKTDIVLTVSAGPAE